MVYKVFLVDDDRYIRKGLISLIDWNSCGFEVCAEADNGEDALDYIKKNNPDLVITDIKMPVLDGLELIKKTIEIQNTSSKFIIITGYSDFKYAQQAIKYNVHDFILKPVDKEEIEETLRKVAEKYKKEWQLQQNRISMLEVTAFNDLITGEIETANQDDCIRQLNIEQTKEMGYIIVEVNNRSANVMKTRKIVEKIICEENVHTTIWFHEHGKGRLGLLVKSEDIKKYNGNILLFSAELQKQLASIMHAEVIIYVGKRITHPSDIKDSFETAKKALQFKYIEDTRKPIIYGKTKKRTVNYMEIEQGQFQVLIEQIEENQLRFMKKTVEAIFEQFQEKAFAKDAVKTSINRIILEVIKTVQSMDGEEKQLPSLQKTLNWDDLPRTLPAIKEILKKFIAEAAELINRLNKQTGSGNIRKIKKYIDTHPQEDLTLKTIANKFYINSVYLGQLFKKTYGIYLKEYILHVRIKEAKKNLRQTDMRIYQIAESVGFANSDYFVTQFEKITGMTPTQYRKKISHENNEIDVK